MNHHIPREVIAYGIVTAFCCLFIVVLGALVSDHGVYHGVIYTQWNNHYNNADQYATLADSLLQGRLDLDLPVSRALRTLDDPYNYIDRYHAASKTQPMFWDHAYYHGKYYSYYGVVPAVVLYLPYQLLTGMALDTVVAVVVLGVSFIIGSSLLVWRIRARWFAQAKLLHTCFAFLAFFFGGNVIYLVSIPRFYSVPILGGLACLCFGFWCWLGAFHEMEGKHQGGPKTLLSLPHLCAGSLLVTLVLGCRPQLALCWILVFPLFWRATFKDRLIFSRKGLANTCALLIPFVCVVGLLGWYNWARFGSPLDFGAYYNLTGHDMPVYQQNWALSWLLVYLMFLAPFKFGTNFPYLIQSATYTSYVDTSLGFAPKEPLFGGYLWSVPTSFFLLALPRAWKPLCQKRLISYIPLLVGISFFVCLFDVHSAGTSPRYFSDFGWALSLAAILVYFSLAETEGLISTFIFGVLLALCVVWALWGLISPDNWDALWKTLGPSLGAPTP